MVMEMKKKIIRTNNVELLEKFTSLNFVNEVILKNVINNHRQLQRILRNINRTENILEATKMGDFIVIRKKQALNFEIKLGGV